MATRTRLRRLLALAIIAFVGGQIVVGVAMAHMSLRVAREPIGTPDPRGAEHVELRSNDGLVLRAWFWPAREPGHDAVLLLHGIGDRRTNVAGDLAPFLLDAGFSVLAPDSRAHGTSDGTLVTYGLKEREDVVAWQRWLTRDRGSARTFALGESFGAAVALQSVPAGADFCAVVAEGTFASFREIAFDRVGGGLGRTLFRPLVETGILAAHLWQGVDVGSIDVTAAVAAIDTPILLIHGDRDTDNPVRHSQLVARAARHADLWIVPGAVHSGAHGAARRAFESRVLRFFAGARGPGCGGSARQ